MAPIHYVMFACGVLLEALVLWRGWRACLWRRYPFFYVYLGFILVRSIGLFALLQLQFSAYAMIYWLSDAVAALLWFFVTWEVFRQTFAFAPAVRRLVGEMMIFLLLALAVVFFSGAKAVGSFPDLERKFSFVQATLLLTTLLMARYYAVPLGRNIWGMALGFGAYVSISVMNFAMFDLLESFVPYWRHIRPLSFIGMLGVWTWALWSYAPNPRPATAALEVYERSLAHWAQAWSELRTALRKAVGL